tara:strand:- start:543 stop:851 length:309 start_codon:yes stop_codon:yes gene_type:complete
MTLEMKRNNIGRESIANDLSLNLGLSKNLSKEITDCFFEILKKILLEDNNLNMVNFASFQINFKKKRTGRNPKTLKVYEISERNVVNFKPSQNLLNLVNREI